MKYPSLMFAGALTFSGSAFAAIDHTAPDTLSDIQVQCIETAYVEELEGDQKDVFVKQCVEEQLAKTKAKDKKA